MAYSITSFQNNLTNSLVALDTNFITYGALVPIPCSIVGTKHADTDSECCRASTDFDDFCLFE